MTTFENPQRQQVRARRRRAVLVAALVLATAAAVAVWRSVTTGGPPATNQTTAELEPMPFSGTPAVALTFEKPAVKWGEAARAWQGPPDSNPFVREMTPALDAYRGGDYARARITLSALSTRYPASIEVMFYLGVTLMLSGDFHEALAPLMAASALDDPQFAGDVAWFLGVAEYRSGRVAEGRQRLSALCADGGSRSGEACAAIAQIGTPGATSSGPR